MHTQALITADTPLRQAHLETEHAFLKSALQN